MSAKGRLVSSPTHETSSTQPDQFCNRRPAQLSLRTDPIDNQRRFTNTAKETFDVRLDAAAQVGRYKIVDRIGHGGMGEVYRAVDTRLEKTVAIKIISPGLVDHPAAAPRFERERQLTAALEHPHICRLLDAGTDEGVTYLAMEYLDGESLAKRLARGNLHVREALG